MSPRIDLVDLLAQLLCWQQNGPNIGSRFATEKPWFKQPYVDRAQEKVDGLVKEVRLAQATEMLTAFAGERNQLLKKGYSESLATTMGATEMVKIVNQLAGRRS